VKQVCAFFNNKSFMQLLQNSLSLNKLIFLDIVVSSNGIEADFPKVEAIRH
jgi:hypothetical protein